MFKYRNFIKENNEDSNHRGDRPGKGGGNRPGGIANFQNFDNKNTKFIRALFKGNKLDNRQIMQKYQELVKFREEAEYLRKEPKYINLFFTFKIIEEKSDQDLRDLYKSIQSHRNTLKQEGVDLTQMKTFEQIHDELTKMELIEKTNKFIKLLPSTLRKIIKGDKYLVEKFSHMLIDYNYDDYKNTFLKKVAKYRTADEFFGALENHLKSFQGISKIFNNIENHPGAKIVHSSEEYLVARIFSKKASMDLGSQQWCISNNSGYMWDNYIVNNTNGYGSGKKPGTQYFIWDFRYSPSDSSSLVGATVYQDGQITAHNKADGSFRIQGKVWAKYCVPFKELSLDDKVRLIADNPKIEEYTGIINNLTDRQQREILKEVPKLLLQFKDLSFLTNQEIWDLVRQDIELGETESIARELTDDQKVTLVVKNPDLLDLKWKNNPYEPITHKLTRGQRIAMISNKHSLYDKFDLSEEEHFELVNLDPKILVTHTVIAQKVDQRRLKEQYLDNKAKWDSQIAQSTGEKKTKIELLLSHLTKGEERIEMETHNNCYIIVARKQQEGDRTVLIPEDNRIIYVEDILSPQNQKISTAMLIANFDDELDGYSTWVPKNVLGLGDLVNDEYVFKTPIKDLINGTSNDENEQIIYNSIVSTFTGLNEG
tara:strand:+ start:149550 stop:151511 length:1962 start_codon:yes stop_codon:yes gene_type:complete